MRLLLAASGAGIADAMHCREFLARQGVSVTLATSQSEILALLTQPNAEWTACIAQAKCEDSGVKDPVDALSLVRIPQRPPIAVMMHNKMESSVLAAAVELGALDILQSPLMEQPDRLLFCVKKWEKTLQHRIAVDDFSSGLIVDTASDAFSLDHIAIESPLESLDGILCNGSATSCDTLFDADWDQSEALVQSWVPAVFSDDLMPASPSLPADVFDSYAIDKELEQAQSSSPSTDSSATFLAGTSRQASLATCDLSGKRKSEDISDYLSVDGDSSRASELADDARFKKQKVEWTPELHNVFVTVVEKIGVDKAVPSTILAEMGPFAIGLTRQNVASHLQKYRNRRNRPTSTLGAQSALAEGSALTSSFLARSASVPTAPRSSRNSASHPRSTITEAGAGQPNSITSAMPCWPAASSLVPAYSVPACFGGWTPMAAPIPPPPAPSSPGAAVQLTPQFVASLKEAMRQPVGKLPIGLRLDAQEVIDGWAAGNTK